MKDKMTTAVRRACMAFTPLEKTHVFKEETSLTGFTLIEVMIVVVIMGILSSLAIPSYLKTREKAYDREAISSLKLIQAANRYYFSGQEHYYPPVGSTTDLADINRELNLDLNSALWSYTFYGAPGSFTVVANRTDGGSRWWIITTITDPACGGSCL